MASRVNTRFLSILVVAVLGLLMVVGGLWYYRLKTNVERHIRAGDAFMTAGQYRDAVKAYGRAVDKKRGNIGHIRKFEEALLELTPLNPDDARQMYSRRMRVLQNYVRYQPLDPAAHQALVDEAVYAARLSGLDDWWATVDEAAGNMANQLSDGDPLKADGPLYRAMAVLHRPLVVTDDEIDAAIADLDVYVRTHPDSDIAWATLMHGLSVKIEKGKAENLATRVDDARAAIDVAAEASLRAVPEGPESARQRLILGVSRFEESFLEGSKTATEETQQVLAAEMRRVIELARATDDPAVKVAAAKLANFLPWLDGVPQAAEMLAEHLKSHPDELMVNALLVELLFSSGELDEAESRIATILEAEPMTVCFSSPFQESVQNQVTSLLVDIAFTRWEQADGEQRRAALARIQERLADLETRTLDPETDPGFMRGKAKLAFARGEYQAAAAHFDTLGRDPRRADADVLLYGALSLERIREIGLAYERMAQLQALFPVDPRYIYECARLAYLSKRYDLARNWLTRLFELDPEHRPGNRLAGVISIEESGGDAVQLDPVARAMAEAIDAVGEGEINASRITLEEMLADDPDNLPLLDTLMRLELRAGRPEQAELYLDRLLVHQPDNPSLRRFKAAISNTDPIGAVAEYVDSLELEEGAHAVALLVSYTDLARAQRALAEALRRQGNPSGADEAIAVAERAETEGGRWLQVATRLAPDDAQLIRFRFREAIVREAWDEAEAIVRRATDLNSDLAGGAMMGGQLKLLRGQVADAVPLLLEATRRIPHSSAAWRALGTAYNQMGEFDQALTAYEQAHANNPNDVETIRQYVSLLVQTGDDIRALRIMRQARRLLPDDEGLQQAWLDLEAEGGDRTMALQTRWRRYREEPENRRNAADLARMLSTTVPIRETILNERGEERFSEFRWGQMSVAEQRRAIDAARAEWHKQADEIIQSLVAAESDDLDLVVLQAELHRERGNIDEGERVIRAFVDGRPAGTLTVPMVLALSQYQGSVGRIDRAVETLSRPWPLAGEDRGALELALGGLYYGRERFEDALDVYQRALGENPDPAIELHVIECLSKLGRFQDADRLLSQRQATRELGFFDHLLAAEIADGLGERQHAEGRIDEARQSFDRRETELDEASRLDPSSPKPFVLRAQALLREFRREIAGRNPAEVISLRRSSRILDDALVTLDEADRVRAGDRSVSLMRASVLEAMTDADGAAAELVRRLDRSPNDVTARRRLVRIQYGLGDVAAATATLDEGIRRNPTLAMLHELKGDMQLDLAQKAIAAGQPPSGDPARRSAAALSSYDRAAQNRRSRPLLDKRAEAMLNLSPPDYSGTAKLLADHDQRLRLSPTLQCLNARALNGLRRPGDARQQLRAAYGLFRRIEQVGGPEDISAWFRTVGLIHAGQSPSTIESFVMDCAGPDADAAVLAWLAGRWAATGASGMDRAIELQQQAISRAGAGSSMLFALNLQLASYMLENGQVEGAVDPIKRALDIDPYHRQALNNLAYLLAAHLGRPQEAMEYARRVVDLIDEETDPPSRRASILDTVGWVHHLNGDNEAAEDYLRRSVRLEEKAGNVFHLATVLDALGRTDTARQWLERAAELATDSRTRAEIDALADDIRTRR